MENQFAKLFTFDDGQLLVTIELNESNEFTDLSKRSLRDSTEAVMRASFESEEECRQAFNDYGEEKALAQFNGLQKMLNR